MSDTVFRLMERHQKLDEALNLARSRSLPDALEIFRLKSLKLAVRQRLGRLMGWRNPLPAHC